MRRVTVGLFVVMLFFVVGCGTGTGPVSKGDVTFEVREFTIDDRTSDWVSVGEPDKDEDKMVHYDGKGTVVAMGDTEMVKRPYLVFIKVTRTKGGNEDHIKERIAESTVINGTGQITARDWGKRTTTMRPEYNFTVIGYVPITPQAKKEQKP